MRVAFCRFFNAPPRTSLRPWTRPWNPSHALRSGARHFIGQKRVQPNPLTLNSVQASAQILDLIDELTALPVALGGHGVDPLSKYVNFDAQGAVFMRFLRGYRLVFLPFRIRTSEKPTNRRFAHVLKNPSR